jgi:DNA-binding CsgD family transcriptional regulator
LRSNHRLTPHQRLSDREYQVMTMIAEGKTTSQIAEILALSVKTVSTYRRRMLDKLDLETTADIVRYAIEHGIGKLP